MPFQYAPAGTYTRGSPVSEVGRANDGSETQIAVTLTRPFFVQRTEVTQAQWTALSGGINPSCQQTPGDTLCSTANANPSAPVENVRWWSAVAFANALSVSEGLPPCYTIPSRGCTGTWQDGLLDCSGLALAVPVGSVYDCTGYRLPTDAEWEYAARAGTTTATYAGNLVGVVNTCDSPSPQPALDGIAWWCGNASFRSQPVGGKTPNAWGLYDVLGNAWEWVSSGYLRLPPGGEDPDPSGTQRVIRGGSNFLFASFARAASRTGGLTAGRGRDLGFRLARSSP